jgi:hypothetical protein
MITRVVSNRSGFDCRLAEAVLACCVGVFPTVVSSQELVPAAYTPAPYGVNVVTVTTSFNDGEINFDPSGPIEEGSGRIGMSSAGYARTFSLAGRSAAVAVIVPYVLGNLEGLYLGESASAKRSGLGDIGIRGAVNLYGGPAMSPKEFSTYRPRTLIGTTVTVLAPSGQYDPSKLINIGTNRWAVKAELGFVRVIGRWAVDAYVGAGLFTDNTEFLGDNTLARDPIYSTQGHLRYRFNPKLWGAFDVNYWRGGQTTINGVVNDDRQSNSRVGLTFSVKLSPRQNLRVAVSTGAVTRIGGDFHSIGASYSYSWSARPKTK